MVKQHLKLNDFQQRFIIAETVAYINQNIQFIYNQATCERDLGLIIDGIIIDVMNGLTANSINTSR